VNGKFPDQKVGFLSDFDFVNIGKVNPGSRAEILINKLKKKIDNGDETGLDISTIETRLKNH